MPPCPAIPLCGCLWRAQAIEALLASSPSDSAPSLPVNVKVVLEGSEELLSPHLLAALREHAELLAADVALSADGRYGAGEGGAWAWTAVQGRRCVRRLFPDMHLFMPHHASLANVEWRMRASAYSRHASFHATPRLAGQCGVEDACVGLFPDMHLVMPHHASLANVEWRM
eukprot:349634-Chlamydomonas_euryale.AAC.22